MSKNSLWFQNYELLGVDIGSKVDGFFCCSLSCIQHAKSSSLTTHKTYYFAILFCIALLEGKQRPNDEVVTTTTTTFEAPSRRITRSMSRDESSIPSSLSLFCISLV